MSVSRVCRVWLSVILLHTLHTLQTHAQVAAFTCQGNTYAGALAACPDRGAQAHSSGGNVTILVSYATNMPNRDATGPAAGVSDPYVKFSVGTTIGIHRIWAIWAIWVTIIHNYTIYDQSIHIYTYTHIHIYTYKTHSI
jgi:hypothetical protein